MMLSMAESTCQLRKLDAKALRSERNVSLQLTGAQRNAVIEQTSVNDEVKTLLKGSGGVVSINDMAAICFALAEAMTTSKDDAALLRIALHMVRCLAGVLHKAILGEERGAQQVRTGDSTFPLNLTHSQRKVVGENLPTLAPRLKVDEAASRTVRFTLAELEDIAEKCRDASCVTTSGVVRNSLLHVVDAATKALAHYTQGSIARIPMAKRLYQLKITLNRIKPPIWRRIQVKDCTLDKLHGHIQLAMGWQNCHLYQFTIKGVRYSDPQFFEEEPDIEVGDARVVRLGEFIPPSGKPFRFQYEYDFGDSWDHDILVERCLTAEEGTRYPLCLEGERACPPEDVGGRYGYQEYVAAMSDPDHERHVEFKQWRGRYDPEKFDAKSVTKKMRRGLPKPQEEDWL